MKSRADWGNRQGNSARCFLYFLNEINDLVSHFEPHQPPHSLIPRLPLPGSQHFRIAHHVQDAVIPVPQTPLARVQLCFDSSRTITWQQMPRGDSSTHST